MMLKVAEYRAHASDCRNMAAKATDPGHRKMLEDMAAAWESLASEREKFLKPSGSARVGQMRSTNT
jgi:hypothetical protein